MYSKAIRTGWIFTLLGAILIVAGINLGGSTGNTGFFALAALGALLIIIGLVTVGVYAGMRRGVSDILKDKNPLLRLTLTAQDYAEFAVAEGDEIKSTNKMSLVIALIFCGLVAIGGPIVVGEDGIILVFVGVGLALLLIISSSIITRYRIKKLKTADRLVILNTGGAYVWGEYHTWSIPTNFLSEAVYFSAGKYQGCSSAVIRITYSALTRTLITPYTILIPVTAEMEEKAKDAIQILKGCVKEEPANV